MKVVNVNVSELVPYANNPRKNEKAIDKVAGSIQNYGFQIPILITKDKEIIAGHTRTAAAKKLGLETIPAIFVEDLTDEQIKAYRLIDNKSGEIATWDFEKLENELDALDDAYLDDLFNRTFSESDEEPEPVDMEINLDDFGDEAFEYECKNCGFRFNA